MTVRERGRPEIWDASTGDIQPLHYFETTAQGTQLRLEMDPHEGVLVVLQPEPAGPQITATIFAAWNPLKRRQALSK